MGNAMSKPARRRVLWPVGQTRGRRRHAREGDAGQDPGLSTLDYFLAFILSRS